MTDAQPSTPLRSALERISRVNVLLGAASGIATLEDFRIRPADRRRQMARARTMAAAVGSAQDAMALSWPEDFPLQPNSPYAASKASSDLVARSYGRTFGMDVRITRCSNNYGPYQYPEKVIPLFVTNLMDGLTVPLYGDGLNVRDWLHVDDHCRGIQLVLSGGRPGEVYNIGGGTELTNRELTELLVAAMGRDWDSVQPVEDRKGHDRRYSVDISKISRELGYRPEVPFSHGLADTIDWYRSNEQWWRPLKDRA